VVLLLPEPVATEVDGLRRACGDTALGTIAPHITVVPPVNVREDDLGAGLAALRSAAASVLAGPFTLTLGPASTFGPASPTLFLDVGGDRPTLQRLRDAVFRAPLHRPVDHPFQPHVTLATEIERGRLEAAVTALADYRQAVEIERVTLLEQRRDGDGRRSWVALADAALGPSFVVERGGLRLAVSDTAVPDPEARALLAEAGRGCPGRTAAPPDRPIASELASRRYLVARADARIVGVLVLAGLAGDRPSVAGVHVTSEHRRGGIGRLLVERAVDGLRPAQWLEADPAVIPAAWLAALGWRRGSESPRNGLWMRKR